MKLGQPWQRWSILAGLAGLTTALLIGAAFWGWPHQAPAATAGFVVSLLAALAGAAFVAGGPGVTPVGKATAARLLVGLAGLGAMIAWGEWERRALLLGFAGSYAILLMVETWALLRLLRQGETK